MANVFICKHCGVSVTVDGWPSVSGCPANPGVLGGHDWNMVGTNGGANTPIRSSGEYVSLTRAIVVLIIAFVLADLIGVALTGDSILKMFFGEFLEIFRIWGGAHSK